MMRGLFIAAALALSGVVLGAAPSANAADKSVELRPRGDGTYIKMRHAHRFLRCPDAYSCYPLYGAYGPYGGRAYWAGYSGFVPPEYR